MTEPIALTVGACDPSQYAVKQFYANGSKAEYGFIKFWRYYPRQYDGLDGLCELLKTLSGLTNCIILRGAPAQGLDLDQWQLRRLHPRGPEPATLRPVSRSWLALDLDDVAVPFGFGDARYLPEAAAYVRDERLPDAFWDKRGIVTATASTGRKGLTIARMRLWFEIDRLIDDKTLSRWATGFRHSTDVPVDPAVFRPVQPIYSGRPLFHGLVDPVPVNLRAFMLEGDPSPVELDVAEFEKPLVKAEKRIAAELGRSTKLGGDWRIAAQAVVGGVDGFFIPLTRVLGLAAKQTTEIADVEVCDFVRELLIEKDAGLDRVVAYADGWVIRTLRSFRVRDAMK